MGVTWRLSDSVKDLVGGYSQEMMNREMILSLNVQRILENLQLFQKNLVLNITY